LPAVCIYKVITICNYFVTLPVDTYRNPKIRVNIWLK
jgi:hypothetical protein